MSGISIIIPVYNREKYIGKAIESVLNQNFDGEIELIISDDGSTDNTLEIVKSMGEQIIIIKKPDNVVSTGPSGARNRGLLVAKMPYVGFLDSDDFYLTGHLNKAYAAISGNSGFGFVFCKTLMCQEDSGAMLYKRWTTTRVLKNDILHPVVSRSFVVHTNAFLFRRDVFSRVGCFNEEYSNAEDSDMWMRISEQYKGMFLDYYGVVYRVNYSHDQLTRKDRITINESSLKVFKDAIDRYYTLGLKSQFRIFSLKRFYYYYKYVSRKYIYRLIAISLAMKYPFGFLQRIPLFYNSLVSKKKNRNWQDLTWYIKNPNNSN